MKEFQCLCLLLLGIGGVALCAAQSGEDSAPIRSPIQRLLPNAVDVAEIEREESYITCMTNTPLIKEGCVTYEFSSNDPLTPFLIDGAVLREVIDNRTESGEELMDDEKKIPPDLGIPGSQCPEAKNCSKRVNIDVETMCFVVENPFPWSVFITIIFRGCLTDEEERELVVIIASIIAVVLFCLLLCCVCFCYYFCKGGSPPRPYSGHGRISKFFCYCFCCWCWWMERAFFKPKPPPVEPAMKPACVCSTSSDEEQSPAPVQEEHVVVVKGVVVQDVEDNDDSKKNQQNSL